MKTYKLGSHNTMSYLSPKQWWMKPFHFVAKCQNKDIVHQYEDCGVRVFDIRIKWDDKNNKWNYAHGSMIFDSGVLGINEILSYLNGVEEQVYIRLILEYSKAPKNINAIVDKFIEDVKEWRSVYNNITFFEFRRKYDWKQLIKSDYNPSVYQAVSSMTGSIIDDWYPYLYAKTHNKDILQQGTDKDILLMDFV